MCTGDPHFSKKIGNLTFSFTPNIPLTPDHSCLAQCLLGWEHSFPQSSSILQSLQEFGAEISTTWGGGVRQESTGP